MSYTNPTRDVKEVVVTIRNLREAETALAAYIPPSGRLTVKNMTLANVRSLLQRLGNPQNQLKVIHVAGTSGKTSTAYYMAALLNAAGQKVGLTVSPHVGSITERVQINGQPMADVDFCRELGGFLDIIKDAGQRPSYFELLYAFTIWILCRRQIDYAVVETGLGGLKDATNVVDRPDKVCVITDIDFDHQDILGKTLPEIAAQKAGIIHDRNHVFMYRQEDEIMKAIKNYADKHQALLHIVEKGKGDDSVPAYQYRNWNLACQIYHYLEKRDKLPHLTSQELAKTRQTRIPGRMEIWQVNGKTLVMDGAHNAQKMRAFIDSFQKLYPGIKPAVLLALKKGKEYQKVVPLLTPAARHIIVTAFETTQDLPIKSMNPDELVKAFRAAGAKDVKVIIDPKDALQELLAAPEDVLVITGSFYLLGQIRDNVGP